MRIIFLTILFGILMLQDSYAVEIKTLDTLEINGFFQVTYSADQDKTDGFNIQRTRLIIKNINSHRKLRVEISATETPVLNKAFIDLTGIYPFDIKAGLFKIPFSHESMVEDSRLLAIKRSQFTEDIEFAEHIGVQVSKSNELLFFEGAVFNGNKGLEKESNDSKDISGRVGIFFGEERNRFGFAGYKGHSPQGFTDTRQEAFLVFNYKRFLFEGEYMGGSYNGNEDKDWFGCYATFGYHFDENITGFVKYDEFARDVDNEARCTETKDYTVGFKWVPDEYTEFKINYLFRQEKEIEDRIANNLLISQLQVRF